MALISASLPRFAGASNRVWSVQGGITCISEETGLSVQLSLVIWVATVMDRDRMHEIQDKLQQLSQWETVSTFSQAFYQLIADRLADQGAAGAGLRLAFVDFLAVEVNYHRQVAALAAKDVMLAGDLQSLSDKRRLNLEVMAEMVAITPAPGSQLQALSHLILAECQYHQRNIGPVVEHLQRAIEYDGGHPLVHFALGYNIYALAVQDCTVMQVSGGDSALTVTDDITFTRRCLTALRALEASLSGTDFDSQVYWWMGHVLDSAGMTEAARDIQSRLTPGGDESWDDDDDHDTYLSELEEAAEAPQYLPQISQDEINRAAVLLRGSFTSAEVLGYDLGEE